MTKNRVTDEQYGRLSRRVEDFKRRVYERTLPFEESMFLLQKLKEGNVAKKLIFTAPWAISPFEQLDIVRERNRERDWGFTNEDFKALIHKIPFPFHPTDYPTNYHWWNTAIVLDIAFHSVSATFHEAWHFIEKRYPESINQISYSHELLRLFQQDEELSQNQDPKPHLQWKIVNFCANGWDQGSPTVEELREETTAKFPHAILLWAASLFDGWITNMDGNVFPFVTLPGYKARQYMKEKKELSPWIYVPLLAVKKGGERIKVTLSYRKSNDHDWTKTIGTPRFVE